MRQRPVRTDAAVLYPHIGVLRFKAIVRQGILCKDAGVRLAVVVHDVALVVDHILDGHRRRDHLTRRAEVVERSSGQGYDGHGQLAQLRVVDGGMRTQRTTELGIEVVLLQERRSPCGRNAGRSAALFQQLHGPVGEQPDADVGQVEMVLQQLRQLFRSRLLQHLLQHTGCPSVAHEDAVVPGDSGIEPQAVAHHVGIGYSIQPLCRTDVDIAADYHRGQPGGSLLHDALIERQLQVEQRLRKLLAALPPEHGYGGQYLAAGSIRRQPAALSAGMEDDAALALQPVFSLLQQPGSTSTRP